MKYYQEYIQQNTRYYSETDMRRMYRLSCQSPRMSYSEWLDYNLNVTQRFCESELTIADGDYCTIIVNLFGAPAAGKSTLAHRLVAALSMQGFLTEYVPEYAKELIYDEQREMLDGSVDKQRIVTSEQMHRVERLLGKVEIIVTDSPALLGAFYADANQPEYENFAEDVWQWHHKQNAINVFVDAARLPFDQRGRKHTEAESAILQNTIMDEVVCTQYFKRECGGVDNFDELLSAIVSQASATRIHQSFI